MHFFIPYFSFSLSISLFFFFFYSFNSKTQWPTNSNIRIQKKVLNGTRQNCRVQVFRKFKYVIICEFVVLLNIVLYYLSAVIFHFCVADVVVIIIFCHSPFGRAAPDENNHNNHYCISFYRTVEYLNMIFLFVVRLVKWYFIRFYGGLPLYARKATAIKSMHITCVPKCSIHIHYNLSFAVCIFVTVCLSSTFFLSSFCDFFSFHSPLRSYMCVRVSLSTICE